MSTLNRRAAIAGALAAAAAARSAPVAAQSDAMKALIAAAKAEGSVVVDCAPIDTVREMITQGFQRAYGIPVTYIGSGNSASGARVRAQRSAGKYLLDVLVSGSDTPILTYLPSGWLDKVEPVLIAPDVVDKRKWKDGHLWFADDGHTILRVLQFVTPELRSDLAGEQGAPSECRQVIHQLACRREAQEKFAEALLSVSLRTDCKYEGLPSWVFPQKGVKYLDAYDYKFVTDERNAAMTKARELLGE